MEQRSFDMHGVFTAGQWNRDHLTCMVFLLQANGTEIIRHASCFYYRPMEQRSFDMPSVFLLQANGTEEMKTQVGEEEEDDMKETPEENETAEEQEQSKPFQSINQPVNLSVKRYQ